MLRGAARGAFQSARQLRRAAAKQQARAGASPAGRGAGGGGRRGLGMELIQDERSLAGQQRRAFGKAYAESVPRTLAVGALGLLNVGAAVGPRIPQLDALLEDDDDGR